MNEWINTLSILILWSHLIFYWKIMYFATDIVYIWLYLLDNVCILWCTTLVERSERIIYELWTTVTHTDFPHYTHFTNDSVKSKSMMSDTSCTTYGKGSEYHIALGSAIYGRHVIWMENGQTPHTSHSDQLTEAMFDHMFK